MTESPLKGVLLWFNPQKGIGIIRSDNPYADDVLCPSHVMQGDPEDYLEGAAVNYYEEQQLIGMVATSVWIYEDTQ